MHVRLWTFFSASLQKKKRHHRKHEVRWIYSCLRVFHKVRAFKWQNIMMWGNEPWRCAVPGAWRWIVFKLTHTHVQTSASAHWERERQIEFLAVTHTTCTYALMHPHTHKHRQSESGVFNVIISKAHISHTSKKRRGTQCNVELTILEHTHSHTHTQPHTFRSSCICNYRMFYIKQNTCTFLSDLKVNVSPHRGERRTQSGIHLSDSLRPLKEHFTFGTGQITQHFSDDRKEKWCFL